MLTQPATAQLPTDTLTRAIAAVFQGTEYHRTLRRTLAEQILHWIASLFRSIASSLDSHPFLRFIVIGLTLAVVAAILARAVYVQRMGEPSLHARAGQRSHGETRDPWTAAHSAAASGNYLDAAHFLYHAVLQTLARSDRIVIESAKTVGDYSRELRRSSSRSFQPYRDFARLYEPIVWGSRGCDGQKFEELSRIASQLSGPSA